MLRKSSDPGAPTETEIEQHNVTHLPFHAWCSCVEEKARERPHRRQDVEEESLAEVVFDYGFLGAQGEEETVAIQVARDSERRCCLLMWFAEKV